MTTYPLNPTPNRVRNLEAYIVHAEDAANRAQTAAGTVVDQVALATTQAQNALKSAQDAAAAAAGTFILRGDATQNFTDPQIAQFWTNLQLNKSFLRGDATQSFTDAQVAQLLANLQIGQLTFGQCRFTYASSTQCLLKPLGGGLLTVNQMARVVPSAGIPFSNAFSAGGSNLSVSTLYYAYVYWTGTALTWEFSTTGYTLDSRGHPVKTGDATRTCVGMAYTDTSGLFNDNQGGRMVASYFNRVAKITLTQVLPSTSSGAQTLQATTQCLSWGDDPTMAVMCGFMYNSSAGQVCAAAIGFNGVLTGGQANGYSSAASASLPFTVVAGAVQSQGRVIIGTYNWVGGGTGNFNYYLQVTSIQ